MSQIKKHIQSNINFTPAVVCFLIKGGKVLLGLRKKVSLGLGLNIKAGIGGKVGDQIEYQDETHDQAVVRELEEEIKVIATQYKKVGRVRFIYPHKPTWNQDVLIYIVEEWDGEPQETEVIQPIWVDIGNLPTDQMWEDNKVWVPEILNGNNIDAIFLYGEDGKIQEYEKV